jgi:hypothetical protein
MCHVAPVDDKFFEFLKRLLKFRLPDSARPAGEWLCSISRLPVNPADTNSLTPFE